MEFNPIYIVPLAALVGMSLFFMCLRSDLASLAEEFGSLGEIQGETFTMQMLILASMTKIPATITINNQGIGVRVMKIFSPFANRIFIPWEKIRAVSGQGSWVYCLWFKNRTVETDTGRKIIFLGRSSDAIAKCWESMLGGTPAFRGK